MTIQDIAKVCHEANRAYCAAIGDHSQLPWEEAPEWHRASAIGGVQFHIDNPYAGPRGSHESWLRAKVASDWIYGPTKDPVAKTHPCMLPYDHLPPDQRLKDALFVGIVHALKSALA